MSKRFYKIPEPVYSKSCHRFGCRSLKVVRAIPASSLIGATHSTGDGMYRILYEVVSNALAGHVMWLSCECHVICQVDESGVEVLHTFNPSTQVLEDYRYPRPGGHAVF